MVRYRWFTLVAMGLAAGCVEPLDTTRNQQPERTLGEDIYIELCHRVAATEHPEDELSIMSDSVCTDGNTPPPWSTPRLKTMHGQRDRLVAAIDAVLSEPVADNIEAFLADIVPLYNDETLQAQTRAMADVIASLEASNEALEALARLSLRKGYQPLRVRQGLAEALLTYPRISELIAEVLTALDDPAQAAEPFSQALEAMALTLENAATVFDAPKFGTLDHARDLLLRTDERFTDGQARWVVKRDRRGVAMPRVSTAGVIPQPFADTNADGQADVDEGGAYVDVSGASLQIGAPFFVPGETIEPRDADERLLNAQGELVYEYVDASKTLAGALLLETDTLLRERPTAFFDLAAPVGSLLGPQIEQTHIFDDGQSLTFTGYDVAQSPVLDLAHGASMLLDDAHVVRALKLATVLLDEHEAVVAQTVGMLRRYLRWADEPPFDALELKPGNTVADDFLEMGAAIARNPGLLEDLIAAMRTPQFRSLTHLFADHFRHRDFITLDPDNINAPVRGDFVTRVDRLKPDINGNQSIMQRLLHMIRDTHRAKHCNKAGAHMTLGPVTYPIGFDPSDPTTGFAECELMQVDNMTIFYLQSILPDDHPRRATSVFGDPLFTAAAYIPEALATVTGIDGYGRLPTPASLNRLLFGPPSKTLSDIMDPARTRDGAVLMQRHADTIFAWELHGFYDAMRPVAEAFANNEAEYLFGELVSLLHEHWATSDNQATQSVDPNQTAYSHQSGLVQYEELIARILDEGDVATVVANLIKTTDSIIIDGVSGTDILIELTRELLLPERNPGIAKRDGSTYALKNDGRSPVVELSPAWLIVDALSRLSTLLDDVPNERDAFEDTLEVVAEKFLTVEANPSGARFYNRRGLAALRTVLPFVQTRIQEHLDAGDIVVWADGLPGRLEDTLTHPAFSGGIRLFETLRHDDDVRREAIALFTYLLTDDGAANSTRDATLAFAVDAVQVLTDSLNLVPLLQRLSPAFDPQQGLAAAGVHFMRQVHDRDKNQLLPRMAANLALPHPHSPQELVMNVLWDAAFEVNRDHPGSGGDARASDYGAALARIREFLLDEDYGLERLYALVENR